jgi:hypothetical protein
LATPHTTVHATTNDDNEIEWQASDWDQWKVAFLEPSAVLWEKKLNVIVQTPVRTVFPTAELNTQGTKVNKLKIEPPLLDGGQGKIRDCNEGPRTNVTYPKAPRDTKHTIAGGNNLISIPIAPTNQCNDIELQDSIPEPTSTPLIAKPNRNNDDMRNGRRQGMSNVSGVKYKSPPSIALCGQSTKCIMNCTNALKQGSDGNIAASHNECANAMTTMDGLQPLSFMDLGTEATGSLHKKLRQQKNSSGCYNKSCK